MPVSTPQVPHHHHHHLSVLLSPSRSRVLLSQTGAELESIDGLAFAHDVRRESR